MKKVSTFVTALCLLNLVKQSSLASISAAQLSGSLVLTVHSPLEVPLTASTSSRFMAIVFEDVFDTLQAGRIRFNGSEIYDAGFHASINRQGTIISQAANYSGIGGSASPFGLIDDYDFWVSFDFLTTPPVLPGDVLVISPGSISLPTWGWLTPQKPLSPLQVMDGTTGLAISAVVIIPETSAFTLLLLFGFHGMLRVRRQAPRAGKI